ncbi:hypothetical protein [Mycolicibacterium komossense]|uniref:UsfY protein n=1 Tax=Mycolicibacterium komossense TaxID=1779 RepID=A0ABT3CLC3_9MYCO|nr:hypothetical protein [Mycolicibacterium komossense]MCV7230240.1 hypothetical protein [Mycolicibacterium komossense]
MATAGSMFPLWRSATLSPDSIERRVYWTGSAIGVALLFASQLPDWESATILAVAIGVSLVVVALKWTNHVKLGGRIYSVFSNNRGPERPPALRSDD